MSERKYFGRAGRPQKSSVSRSTQINSSARNAQVQHSNHDNWSMQRLATASGLRTERDELWDESWDESYRQTGGLFYNTTYTNSQGSRSNSSVSMESLNSVGSSQGHARGYHSMSNTQGHARGYHSMSNTQGHARGYHSMSNTQGHARGYHSKDSSQGHAKGYHSKDGFQGHTGGYHSKDGSQGHTGGYHSKDGSQGHTGGYHSMSNSQGHTGDDFRTGDTTPAADKTAVNKNKIRNRRKNKKLEKTARPFKTIASIEIMKQFTSEKNLKEIINQHINTSEKCMVTLNEASVVCGKSKGQFILVVNANKLMAEKVVKEFSQNVKMALNVPVSFEIANSPDQEEEDNKTFKQTNIQDGERKEPRAWSNPEQDFLKPKTKVETSVKKYGAQNKMAENVNSSKLVKTEETSSPRPTKVSVSVGKSFSSKTEARDFFQNYLYHQVSMDNLSEVQLLDSRTIFEMFCPSKSAASRLVKKLNRVRLEGISVRPLIADTAVGKNPPLKSEHLRTQVDATVCDIDRKMVSSMEKHKVKIRFYEEALKKHEEKNRSNEESIKTLDSPAFVEESEDDVDNSEELALRDKFVELTKQLKVFEDDCNELKERVKQLNLLTASMTDLNNVLETVGVECQRLSTALPIYARRKDIVEHVKANQVSVILGETGSGKSTQIAQYLYEAGLAGSGAIICTQPRKVAAITLAERVAKEMVKKVGGLVGYKTGIKKTVSQVTKIIFSTDHCLLNECLKDAELTEYSCIIVDEAHERSIYTDLLLGMIKACLPKRPDLKVVITSATIEPELFIRYFQCGPELRVSGRTFPVDVLYEMDNTNEFEDYEKKAVAKAVHVHKNEGPGDILVFLTSPVEIMRCCEELVKQLAAGATERQLADFKCFPLHGQLPPDEQKKVFQPLSDGVRKIVFATNCAETSITIDGIKYVIDTGVAKEMKYDPKKNINLLGTHVISKSSADQRKGRAGRTASGKCYRLYTEESYHSMATISDPEILRVHLGQAVLKLAELGIDCTKYEFVQPPSKEAIDSALTLLHQLGALNSSGITDIGRWISKLPFDPRQGYLIFQGNKENLLYDSVVVAALITHGTNLFYRGLAESEQQKSSQKKNLFSSEFGDIFTHLQVYKQCEKLDKSGQSKWCRENSINYKIFNFVKQCVGEVSSVLKKELGTSMDYVFNEDKATLNALRKIIFLSYLPSLSHYLGHIKAGYFVPLVERQVHFHPSSSLVSQNAQPEWVVYTELTKTSRDFIKGMTVVDEDWVTEAIASQKISLNLQSVRERRIKVVHKEEVGRFIFQKIVGPRYSNLRQLENELLEEGMANIVVEADRELGTIEIYSTSTMVNLSYTVIGPTKVACWDVLKSEEEELCLLKTSSGKDKCGFRVSLGQGGTVKCLLLPDQSNKVLVRNTSRATTEEEVREKFESFGHVKQLVRFKKFNPWGFVRYASYLEAERAAESTSKDEYMAGKLKIDKFFGKEKSKFEAKLTYCRRPIKGKGTAFIKCPPNIREDLFGRHLSLSTGLVDLKYARDSDDLICFKTGSAEEIEIKDRVLDLLHDRDEMSKKIRITVAREKATIPIETEVKEFQKKITTELQCYIPQEKFQLNLIPPKENSINLVGFIQFDDPVSGFHACRAVENRFRMLGQKALSISPSLKTTMHVPKFIMSVCETRLDEITKGLKYHKGVEVTKRCLKKGDFVLEIKSVRALYIVEARDLIQKELDGEVIDCGVNDLLRNLIKQEGREFLRQIEKSESVLIVVDDRREKVYLHGAMSRISQCQSKINAFLDRLSKGRHVSVNLRGPGRPMGLMKALLVKYDNLQEDMTKTFQLSSVNIDFKLQKLSLVGDTEAVDKALASITELESSLVSSCRQAGVRELPDCTVCMCPVDSVDDVYRLELCGHCYCLTCLKGLFTVSVDEKKFPLECADEGCQSQLVWKDFQFMIRNKWVTEEKLVHSSETH
ncbi:uncharacterized protein LOC131942019 isoform X1 [Physella acuta]|uniref:uncharacterized protein LOC131942019 isoform X1 n=1 Tax=Physella acuta TaxID=109671 RepID=UPI0027DCAC2B|nr:uncharacterized protein LOC131942019 isoform X1 [Physella acuta]